MFSNQVDMAQHNWSFQDNIIKIMNTPLSPLPSTTTKKKNGDYSNGQKSQHVTLFLLVSHTLATIQIKLIVLSLNTNKLLANFSLFYFLEFYFF